MTAVDAELRNWGRWVRDRTPKGHCRSIEHRFRHPRWRQEQLDEAPPPAIRPVDPVAAMAVERIMRHVPELHRSLLRLWYVEGASREWICRRLAISLRSDWDDVFARAQSMVDNLLERHAQPLQVVGGAGKRGVLPVRDLPVVGMV